MGLTEKLDCCKPVVLHTGLHAEPSYVTECFILHCMLYVSQHTEPTYEIIWTCCCYLGPRPSTYTNSVPMCPKMSKQDRMKCMIGSYAQYSKAHLCCVVCRHRVQLVANVSHVELLVPSINGHVDIRDQEHDGALNPQ